MTSVSSNDPWESPIGLRSYGTQFVQIGSDALQAYRVRKELAYSYPLHIVPPLPYYYPFLHGIELGLKSYLLQVGVATMSTLRSREIGHNLNVLLSKAIKNGLHDKCPNLTDEDVSVVGNTSGYYAEKEFEYICLGYIQLECITRVERAAKGLFKGLNRMKMRDADEQAAYKIRLSSN